KEIGAATFGIEGQRMRAFEMLALRKHLSDNAIQDAQSVLSGPRLNKSGAEIELLERAIEITETSLHETLEVIRTGMSELEIKSILVQRMHANGADDLAFEPIVLAGPNSANPHGHAGEHRLAPGEPLLFDFGASYGGYNADITRTVFCEYASEEHELFYNTVLAANALGREISAPGLTCDDLDNRVTDVLRASPFAKFVVHKTGHGLGLDVHEAPQVMAGNFTALEDGMVITIEPGLYKSGDIGVRVEDDVLITPEGARSLTGFPREIQFVGGAA
ncbi:MAG: M24 family metallopeptidase, partial [Halioglobus sp.]|nr:M24 family metallopeptidase [Halioglobus sp.]